MPLMRRAPLPRRESNLLLGVWALVVVGQAARTSETGTGRYVMKDEYPEFRFAESRRRRAPLPPRRRCAGPLILLLLLCALVGLAFWFS